LSVRYAGISRAAVASPPDLIGQSRACRPLMRAGAPGKRMPDPKRQISCPRTVPDRGRRLPVPNDPQDVARAHRSMESADSAFMVRHPAHPAGWRG
jgi:hypothetical protein